MRKKKELIKLFPGLLLFLLLGSSNICCAESPNASQIERSQEILEKDKILKDKLEEKEKVFIKKITVQGATLITGDQIKEIILPFTKHWLTNKDIQQILDLITQAYQEAGYAREPAKTSFRVKGSDLEIQINEIFNLTK